MVSAEGWAEGGSAAAVRAEGSTPTGRNLACPSSSAFPELAQGRYLGTGSRGAGHCCPGGCYSP